MFALWLANNYNNNAYDFVLQENVKAPPLLDCSYETTDVCTGKEPLSCCQRINGLEVTASPASTLQLSVFLIITIATIVITVLC